MKPTSLLAPGLAVGALLALPVSGHGQTSPFLPEARYRDLVNEISGDRAYENVRWLTHYHRTGGSADFFLATEWIRKAAVEAGLEDVKLIRQTYREKSWSCQKAEAWLVAPDERKLADYREVAVSIADGSRSAALEAELVDVGAGDNAADYQGREVKGKVVLGSAGAGVLHREAVLKRGALGVISYATNRPEIIDAPDQVAWQAIDAEAKGIDGVKDGTPGTFGFSISPRRGRALSREMKGADKPFKVKVQVEAGAPEKGEQAMVEGWIKGTEISDQQIVLTAHIQEEMTSANDDGSGCGNLLEIGRALTRLIKEGKLPRPKRDLRFWWVNEFSSEEQFFRENPKEPRKMLLNLNQDMVGARQSWGGRVQYASRLPWSLPHALDDVMESVLGMVSDGNTSFLTTRGTKLPVPFTREITAVKGSREPFHARMVPYFDSTDHHAFNPAPVSVPGTSLTNWPDEYIHSTGDDLENIDATQLERNAVVVAAVATYFAGVSEDDAPALAAYVATRSRARIAADVATAVAYLAESAPADRDPGLSRGPGSRAPLHLEGDGSPGLAAPSRPEGTDGGVRTRDDFPPRGRARIRSPDRGEGLRGHGGQEPAQRRAQQGREGHGRPGLRAHPGHRQGPGRARRDARGGSGASRHDALRGAELRRRQAQRLRYLRSGRRRGALGGNVVLR